MAPQQFRTLQGTSSATFKPPPTDGSLDLLEIYDFHAKYSPEHPIFRYMDENERAETIYWEEAARAFHVAGQLVMASTESNEEVLVIGILATLDIITYYTLIIGIMHAGYIPFLISTRNSDAAVAHLLKSTNTRYLFVSKDAAMQNLANSAISKLNEESGKTNEIEILTCPVFDDFFKPQAGDFEPFLSRKKGGMDETIIILHSSGSTSFPKPISISHRNFLDQGLEQYYAEIDFCGEIVSITACPMFHITGAILIPRTAMTGIVVAAPPPINPPVIPTPENIFKNVIITQCTMLIVPPWLLEEWAKDPVKVEVMKSFSNIGYAGGPLSQSCGNMLAGKGINLSPIYGMTEMGSMIHYRRKPAPEDWGYFELAPTIDSVLIPVEGIDNVFQLICKKNKFRIPSVLNTVIDGQPALDTKDLLIRHPTKHGLFQGYGRADDQITHSTGEKTNPGPIESLLLTDKRIASAIMFGRSKFQAGVLIMPSNDWVFEPSDLVKLSEYRNMIWETVQRANAIAPQHSRIFKELIVVAHPSKSLEMTPKGSPRRQISLKSYEEEIENAYKAVEESSQPHIRVPATWDMLSVMVFVSEVVNDALGFKVNDDDDFFRMGADSICATYIRNTITRVMRDTNIVSVAVIRSLPPDFVYGYSSIATLSKFVYDITANAHALETGNEATAQDKYDDPEGDYVWPKMSQVGETILQVRKGKGEPPLMAIHGAGGRVDAFVHFQQKFRSALWLLQVTPDLPRNSLREHAEHFYKKIKELRPHGPYRLAAYSGSHFIAFLIVEMLLRDGEEVIQMSLIDHSPSFMFSGLSQDAAYQVDPDADSEIVDIKDSNFRELFKERIVNALYAYGAREGRTHVLQAYYDAWKGRPAPNHFVEMSKTFKIYADQVWDFVEQLPGYRSFEGGSGERSWERALFAVEEWLKTIKVPVTVYVASYGVIGGVKDEVEREKWSDLGVCRCFPDARVVHLDTGHFTILSNETIIQDLQVGYI
ncbi:acetyl-CoA synthetase-like protein [Dendrothele bispora CBS 962.96]|uniref:Acetyl-CoA synthetase-like protein n=1 Tax=Dendrothele bispora (strain CBS 962.96) TaxID=1314807 RepID=A0A4S8MD26_DENBC|nr:acetyl-CoA synthetase-like protein [Dendrothele bispora CBS 962.96]